MRMLQLTQKAVLMSNETGRMVGASIRFEVCLTVQKRCVLSYFISLVPIKFVRVHLGSLQKAKSVGTQEGQSSEQVVSEYPIFLRRCSLKRPFPAPDRPQRKDVPVTCASRL